VADRVKWAADLIRKLQESGTGQAKLNLIRAARQDRFAESPHLPDDHPDRHLTAAEAVALLDAHPLTAGGLTAVKARSFAETGEWVEPPAGPSRFADEAVPPPPAEGGDDLPAALTARADDPDAELHRLGPQQTADQVGPQQTGPGVGKAVAADGLEKLTVAELQGLAADRNVAIPDHAKKADIVAALRAAAK